MASRVTAMRKFGSVIAAWRARSSASVAYFGRASLTVSRRSSIFFGTTPRCFAAYMSRRATSISRTAPRAQAITSVVRT